VIFSNIFLSILHNIGLYIYIVKYKSGIKIPNFLQNIFFKKVFYSQILKTFPSIFSLKNLHLSHVLKKNPKIDIITSL